MTCRSFWEKALDTSLGLVYIVGGAEKVPPLARRVLTHRGGHSCCAGLHRHKNTSFKFKLSQGLDPRPYTTTRLRVQPTC